MSLGRAALALALRELGAREAPLGSNRGTLVDTYAPRAVRHGAWTVALGQPWCARFVSELLWRAWASENGLDTYGELPLRWSPVLCAPPWPPVGLREAVCELHDDAVASGAWREVATLDEADEGALLVFGRDGHDPRRGGPGHVGFAAERLLPGAWRLLSGNDGDAVRLSRRTLSDRAEPLVGWISLAG